MSELMLRRLYSFFPSGVVAVCARSTAGFIGMTLSTFIPVSLDPAMVAICVRRESTTWPALAAAPRLGLAVLSAGHEETARQLSTPAVERFTDLAMETDATGAAWLADASVVLSCSTESEIDAGDHLLVLLAVNEVVRHGESDPLVFHARQMRPLGRRAVIESTP